MRLPCARLRLRTLLIAEAVAAILLAGGLWVAEMVRMRSRHLERVAWHTRQLQIIERGADKSRERLQSKPSPRAAQAWERLIAYSRPWIAYHRRMVAIYRRAATFPWLHVEPKPPHPGTPLAIRGL